MARTPKLTLVCKSTFLHVEVSEPSDDEAEVFSLPACRSSGSLRRATSQPSSASGRGAWSTAPIYVDDGTCDGWRKVPSEGDLSAQDFSPRTMGRRSTCGSTTSTCSGTKLLPRHAGTASDDESTASSSSRGTSSAPTAPPSPAEGRPQPLCGLGRRDGAEVASSEPPLTTVMVRNLPNTYSRDQLRRLLEAEGFVGRFNFLYLPMDFKTAAGLGFAFVNLLTFEDAERFRDHFSGFNRWGVPTAKVCNVSWATPDQQGLDANIERYRNSSVMHKSVAERCKPLLLVDGAPVKFPKNTKRLWPPNANFGVRANRGANQA